MIALILIVAALLRGEFKWVKAIVFMGYCIKKPMDLFFDSCSIIKRGIQVGESYSFYGLLH